MNKSGPEKPDFTETTLTSKSVYQGNFFEVREDQVRLPDGNSAIREHITHPGAVVVIAVLADGKLVMERQYRYPLREHFYELPAGKLHPGEDPLECAQRELREETGYVAQEWRYLGATYPCIGYSNEKQLFYIARGLSLHERKLDDGEFLQVLTLDLPTLLAWVREGKITDGKTLNGLFLYQQAGGWIDK
ncbi:MAG: NUDIX domain-containing protein [Burkholderiales bacterium]